MKKWSKQWTIRAGALALATACLGAGVALAAGGDENDPLVTLSYLEQTAIPQVVEEVEEHAAVRQRELEESFDSLIAQYRQESAGGGTSASYTLVTMASGQTMSLEVGCEVLLRIGSATVNANTSPALIDLSTGGTVESGTSLTRNHLYMATIADRTLTPTTSTVKLLVRGSYSVA